MTVLERSSAKPSGGTGIGIDRQLLSSATGVEGSDLSVIERGFQQTAWGLVRAVLVKELRQRPGVSVHTGHNVLEVKMDEGGRVVVVRSPGGEVRADLVVGADGFGSVVRRFVAPEHADAIYSGYMLWRGLVDEQQIPGGFAERDIEFAEHLAPTARLVTFGVPGSGGDTRPSRRCGSFSWFDRSRTQLLRQMGYLDGDVVRGTLTGRRAPDHIVAELRDFARRYWPSPWDDAIDQSLLRREFIGTPIAEYLPLRLVRGAIALVGDAAHVVSPVTGAGFHNGLLDVEALAAALRNASRDGIQRALGQYEKRRLQRSRLLVTQSQQWSRAYVASH